MSETCASCAAVERKGYCAPGRCYCAHDTCPADWHPLPPLPKDTPGTAAPTLTSWANREDSTWIDKL